MRDLPRIPGLTQQSLAQQSFGFEEATQHRSKRNALGAGDLFDGTAANEVLD